MILSALTLQVLKSFASINQGIIIKEGSVLRTISVMKNTYAEFNGTDIFPKEFAIYDMNELLSVLSLFPSAEIEFEAKRMVMTHGRIKSSYFYSSPSVVIAPGNTVPELPSVEAEFVLTKQALEAITKASAVMKLKDFGISEKGIRVFNSADASTNEFLVEVDEMKFTGDKEFVINVDNLKLMPFDYTVRVSDAGLAEFTSDLLRYFLALEA
jgi:hypothetical protein